MGRYELAFVRLVVAACVLAAAGCAPASTAATTPNPIIGTWLVKDQGAPFPYHMYVFNADGTMQQANPDAGDAHTSDSDGKGAWLAAGTRIRGKWIEVTADRASRQFAGRGELTYEIAVSGDDFAGSAAFRSYDANGVLVGGPDASSLAGHRVTPP